MLCHRPLQSTKDQAGHRVPCWPSGVRSVTPRPGSQTAPKCLKVSFCKHGSSEYRQINLWAQQMAPLSDWEQKGVITCFVQQYSSWVCSSFFSLLFFPTVLSVVVQCTDRSAGLQPRVRDIFTFPGVLSYSCNTVSGFSTIRDHIQMSFNGNCLNPWLWFILSWGQDIHP